VSGTEDLAGQDMLPGKWPEPIITADIYMKTAVTEALEQFEYFIRCIGAKQDGEDELHKERRLYKANMHLFSCLVDAVTIDFLRELQGYNRAWADKFASELKDKLDGEYYAESMWGWAQDLGLDPDSIIEAAKAKFAEKEAT